MLLECWNKFGMLLNIDTKLSSLMDGFTKIQPHLWSTKREKKCILKRKHAANEQYSRRKMSRNIRDSSQYFKTFSKNYSQIFKGD